MKHMNLRKTLSAISLMGGMIVVANAQAQSHGGNAGPGMMGGNGVGWMGGHGGPWMPTLLVIVVAGIVAWIVAKRGRSLLSRATVRTAAYAQPLTPSKSQVSI